MSSAIQKLHSLDEATDFFSQLKALGEFKWPILGCALIGVLLAVLYVYTSDPIYRATSSVLLEYRQNNVIEVAKVYESGVGTDNYYGTQYNLISSRDMAERAIERINWDQYPELAGGSGGTSAALKEKVFEWFPFLKARFSEAKPDDRDELKKAEQEKRVQNFINSRSLEPVYGTQIIRIHFQSKSRGLAQDAANALAEAYIESGFEAQFEATRRATEWLNDRLGNVKSRLEFSEKELQRFREEKGIVNVGGGRAVLETQLADNLQRLRDAQREKTTLQNTYAKIRAAGGNPESLQRIPGLLVDELVQTTKEVFLVTQNNVSELQTRYGPKHPEMVKARAALEESRRAYYSQLRSTAESIRSQFEIASRNVESLSEVVEATQKQIVAFDRQEYELQILRREAETNAQLYDSILTRFKETDVTGDFQPIKARVVDTAVLPSDAYLPNIPRALLVGGLAGLVVGLGLAILRIALSAVVKSGDELESVSGKPVFASVPDTGRRLLGGSLARMVDSKPQSTFAEGIRTIRTGILLSDLDQKKKRILITSALPQEGKSSVATNLALAFSQMERVLLLDCDFRKPSLNKYLGVKGASIGLSEVLKGDVDQVSKAIHHVAPNVDLLPVGKQLPSPGQVLTSKRFQEVLDELSQHYDRVIIDSAPCQPVSDTLLLAKYVDGLVFIVRYDSTSTKVIQTALKRFDQSGAPVLGTVLNRVDHRRAIQGGDSYYYGDGYY